MQVLMHNYITDPTQITTLLFPQAPALVEALWANRGRDGIRVSAILALLVPAKYHPLAREMVAFG